MVGVEPAFESSRMHRHSSHILGGEEKSSFIHFPDEMVLKKSVSTSSSHQTL